MLDLLIICSSLQYISFCPDVYLLATFSAVLATLVSWLVFFYIFLHLQFCNVWGNDIRARGHLLCQHIYDSASQQYLALQRSGSNPQHTCKIYPCLNLLEWALNVRCLNLFLSSLRSLDDMNDMMTTPVKQKEEDRSRVTPTKASPCKVANEAIAKDAKGAKWPFTLPEVPKARARAMARQVPKTQARQTMVGTMPKRRSRRKKALEREYALFAAKSQKVKK